MSDLDLRNITNNFQDVRLGSLASWRDAALIQPQDHGGPYVVMQRGFDPQDPKCRPDEFILGRGGKWLSLSHFYRLPKTERRAEFVFGTAAEVMTLMHGLPPKVEVLRPGTPEAPAAETEPDDLRAAIEAGVRTSPNASGSSR
ncbi:MAG: hypothetical protein KF791_09250 [Verrucomicrobiae bacterium]|nr:hypothetical protein [Verrucomicrobiae bacterium]